MSAVAEKLFDLRTHNGCITILSLASGEHRTVKVSTQKADAKFMPGKRLVSLLSGPDNTSDYVSFGVLSDDGRVHLWKKHRSSAFYGWLQRFLQNPERFDGKVEINFEGRCRVCNRELTDPLSVELGIGPVCRGDA